jgi:gamma-glutamyltranspeptidase/glutathione hydrolase
MKALAPAFSASLRAIVLVFLGSLGFVHAAGTPPGYALASAHPLATRAGAEILDAGGNAFDAAIAVSAALSVVEPQASAVGGGGFFLLHRQADGLQVLVDGREVAPLAATADMYLDKRGVADPKKSRVGALAAAIPGGPAAWVHIAGKYGSKPLPELLAPAIRYAREGFPADARFVKQLARVTERMSPAAAQVFMPGGKPPAEGALIRQPELAAVLELIAGQKRAGFYEGVNAERMVAAVRAAGGIWSAEDLSRYRVVERKPLSFFFRDHRIVSAPPPSSGGVILAQVLGMLEARSWPPADPVQAKHVLVEAMRRAYRDRRELGDPDFVFAPLYRLLSPEYLRPLAREIDPERATPSELQLAPAEGAHTTHFSILDAQGNRVAGTETLNEYFGCGFMAPGTGILLNNEMDDFSAAPGASNAYELTGSVANAIAPGRRPLSSMAPTFVEGPRGLLILGTPGGSRIPSMVLLGTLAFVQGADAAQIVGLRRYHHQYLPDRIEYEPGALSEAEQSALKALGHTLRPVETGYGNMQAVWWDSADRLEAAADPRGAGAGVVKRLRAEAAAPQVGR